MSLLSFSHETSLEMFCPACVFTFLVVVCERAYGLTCNCSSNVSRENGHWVSVSYKAKCWSVRS